MNDLHSCILPVELPVDGEENDCANKNRVRNLSGKLDDLLRTDNPFHTKLNYDTKKRFNRVLHKLFAIQECQYYHLRLSCTIRNEL